jgi:hypothetical protein
MGYIITILTSVASAMLVFVLQGVIRENNRLKREKEQSIEQREKALENGVVCLLRVKLIEYHSKYMSLGEITTHAYENWTLMYKAYKDLKGNGMIDHMKAEIEELHFKKG